MPYNIIAINFDLNQERCYTVASEYEKSLRNYAGSQNHGFLLMCLDAYVYDLSMAWPERHACVKKHQ